MARRRLGEWGKRRRQGSAVGVLLFVGYLGLVSGGRICLIGTTDHVRYQRPPSLNSGVLAPGPDGSEPGADVFISGTLRCYGPFERATCTVTGIAVMGAPLRPLTATEADALAREWAASKRSRGHRWLRDAVLNPSPGSRLTARAVGWTLVGVAGLASGTAAFVMGMRQVVRMRRNQRALYNNLRGLCPACGYSLRGGGGPTCPECGADVAGVVAEARRIVHAPVEY